MRVPCLRSSASRPPFANRDREAKRRSSVSYRIIPGPIMSRVAPIIGAHQAAIVVHMKIHGTATRIASTPVPIRITFAEVGHGSRAI